ncbi:hypothetical protein HY947_00800 [Candidatus Gottesmanbacteria bacterium]|nr:hypothetical protein [Candidatus Gottesmanbacteria bacterium]
MPEIGESHISVDPQLNGSGNRKSELIKHTPELINVVATKKQLDKWINMVKIAFMVPALACGMLTLGPKFIKDSVYAANDMYYLNQHGRFEQFDPSLGADEITPRNHKALVVVHEGFGLDNDYFWEMAFQRRIFEIFKRFKGT